MKAFCSFLVLPLLAVLTGCSTALVAPDKPAAVGDGITVTPQRPWNRIATDPEAWSTQGPQVDMVRFFSGIRSGRPLMPGVPDKRFDFAAKMLPNDIQDLVVTTLQMEGYTTAQAGNLAPCPFGGDKGFCFDLSFASSDGLEMKGLAMARKHNDRVDLICSRRRRSII
jgi:hypothetical protein